MCSSRRLQEVNLSSTMRIRAGHADLGHDPHHASSVLIERNRAARTGQGANP